MDHDQPGGNRLRNINITSIALCARGRNLMRTVYKAEGPDKGVTFHALSKALDEKGELLSVIYAPDAPDFDGDSANADEIKKACHRYNRDHRALDIEHNGEKLGKDQAYVAENFIVAKGDERFAGWKDYSGEEVGDLTGAWATVTKIESEILRKAFRDGTLDGTSMFGTAEAGPALTKSAEERVFDLVLKAVGNIQPHEENKVNPDEVKALLKAMKEELLAELKPATPAAPAPAASTEPAADDKAEKVEAPEFDGDMSVAGLERFQKALRGYELRKAMASGTLTAEQIGKMIAKAKEVEPSDAEAGIEAEDNDEVKDLKRTLHKALNASNVSPVTKAEETDEFGFVTEEGQLVVSKAQESWASEIAEIANVAKGYAPAASAA